MDNAKTHLQQHVAELEQQHRKNQLHTHRLQQQVAQLKYELEQANASIAKQATNTAQLGTAQPLQGGVEQAQAHQPLNAQQQNAGVAAASRKAQLQEGSQRAEGRTSYGAGSNQAEAESTSGQGAGRDENESAGRKPGVVAVGGEEEDAEAPGDVESQTQGEATAVSSIIQVLPRPLFTSCLILFSILPIPF